MAETVSCVIVTYNSARWLQRAIASVVAQTRPVDEIILADDGSTDDTRAIIAAWAGRDGRIRPVLRESNLGTAANRDLALRAARGAFLTTLDGDDFYFPDKIRAELELVAGHGGRCVACSGLRWVDASGKTLRDIGFTHINVLAADELLAAFALRAFPLPRDMLLAKALYLESEGFDHGAALYEDWDFKLRLCRAGGIWKASSEPGLAWRRHGGGGSVIAPEEHCYWALAALYKNRPWLEERLGRDLVRQAVLARFAALSPAEGRNP